MAEIKRPNYFTYQFLVEKDFDDEQAYHRQMRLRHNRSLHSKGVADGFEVTRVAANQVRVAPGMAIDKDGREIVLEDPQVYTLVSGGNNADVFLTIAYQEAFDPADHYTQGNVDDFTRTTERPKLADNSAPPAADSALILLAKIHLNASGAIESDGSIDLSVRPAASSKLAIAVTNSVTVATDTATKKITIGETHSARTDNPHVTTAQQIDTQGGANRIVAQINAGTGTIANARLEQDMTTGLCTFSNLLPNQEQFSNEIDPGLGPGPVRVDFAFDDLFAPNFTVTSDTNYARSLIVRTEVNRNTGRFSIVATRTSGTAGPARIRWYAFKVRQTPDVTVNVGVTIAPPAPTIPGNTAQLLTASVSNAFPPNVNWTGPFPAVADNGTLTSITPTTVVYTSGGHSGTFEVRATSVTDPTKFASVFVVVNAEITVILSQTTATIFTNGSVTLTGDVINTTNKGINWSTTGGTLSATSGATTTFTPSGPGTFTVTGTSAQDNSKKTNCLITVNAVTISAAPANPSILSNGSTTVSATIGPAGASPNALWSVSGGTVLPGPSPSTTFTPNGPGTYTITAKSVQDQSKTTTCTVTVTAVVIQFSAGSQVLSAGGATTITAQVSPNFADQRATWVITSGAGSLTTGGPSTSTTYNAPNAAASVNVKATSIADSSKFVNIPITVQAPPPPPPPPPPPGKLAGVITVEQIAGDIPPLDDTPATPAKKGTETGKARTFIRPTRRPKPKLPPDSNDE